MMKKYVKPSINSPVLNKTASLPLDAKTRTSDSKPNAAINTAKNTVISIDFLVWKVCGKPQFPHSFGRTPETM